MRSLLTHVCQDTRIYNRIRKGLQLRYKVRLQTSGHFPKTLWKSFFVTFLINDFAFKALLPWQRLLRNKDLRLRSSKKVAQACLQNNKERHKLKLETNWFELLYHNDDGFEVLYLWHVGFRIKSANKHIIISAQILSNRPHNVRRYTSDCIF